jgi:hypothetical protein
MYNFFSESSLGRNKEVMHAGARVVFGWMIDRKYDKE